MPRTTIKEAPASRMFRSDSLAVQLARILFVILLAVIILIIELPQAGNGIHKPSVLTMALAGIFFLRLATKPGRSDLCIDALTAGLILLVSLPHCHNILEGLLSIAAALGIAGFIGLGVRSKEVIRCDGGDHPFAAAVLLCAFSIAVGFFFQVTVVLAPKTFDTYLYAFDNSLGFQSSFLIGRLFMSHPLLQSSSLMAYHLLPTVIAGLYALQYANPKLSSSSIMIEFSVTAAVGWILYLVYPAAGPIHAFHGTYPDSPPMLSGINIDFQTLLGNSPRNCMPSLHAAWALLIFWNSRPFSFLIRLLAVAFLFFTLLATLGLGEHYLIDLVVALPFALGIRGICAFQLDRSQRDRLTAVIVGFLLTAGCIVALRQKAIVTGMPALVSWICITLITAICVYFERKLSQKLFRDQN
jgi:hypothetical protein